MRHFFGITGTDVFQTHESNERHFNQMEVLFPSHSLPFVATFSLLVATLMLIQKPSTSLVAYELYRSNEIDWKIRTNGANEILLRKICLTFNMAKSNKRMNK